MDSPTDIQDWFTVSKLVHALGALYIWELVTTLDFEWDILTGARPYKWTIWLYSGSRLLALISTLLNLASVDAVREIDCEVWVVLNWLTAGGALVIASILITLRIAAVWEWNRPVLMITVASVIVNVALNIYSMATVKATWDSSTNMCIFVDTARRRGYIIATLVGDVVLFSLMLFGLLRWRRDGWSTGVWYLLYKQGLQWIVIVAVSEVPPTIFILLNLSDPWNMMFQVPGYIFPVIGVTRLYRGLLDYSSVVDLELFSKGLPFSTPIVDLREESSESRGCDVVVVDPLASGEGLRGSHREK